jgi:DNA-binding MarR family transcriptional regulator
MTLPHRTLGTLLRHVIELLDGAVEQSYVDAGLDYRPRYTPVLQSLLVIGPASIKTLASHAGLTHSAASQTVAQMKKSGLLNVQRGEDQRQQVVSLSPKAVAMVPAVQHVWLVTNEAARDLENELAYPLAQLLDETISALEHQAFSERLGSAARGLNSKV